jgi:putative transposase
MPWKDTGPMDQRLRFVAAISSGGLSMSEACRLFGVSRKSGYKWLDRYKTYGPGGLHDRFAGAEDCAVGLGRDDGGAPGRCASEPSDMGRPQGARLPTASTSQAAVAGCEYGRRPVQSTRVDHHARHGEGRHEKAGTPLAHVHGPNDGWCADFKGHFRVGNGQRCDPLTVTDAFSRFLLCCQGLNAPTTEGVRPLFEATFREYGLPVAIRTDNGPPFATRAPGGLSRLSVWWVKLGIRLERIEPGKPQ